MGIPGLSWFEALAGFGFLILIHELGHFLALKMVGLPVFAFSIGFGSPLWERKIGGTTFRLGYLPFGGYVLPEDPEELERREQAGEDLLAIHPPHKSIIVALFGPLANFLAAFALLLVILLGWGRPTPVPVVKSMVADSPASHAGLKQGDRILKINGQGLETWPQLIEEIQRSEGQACRLNVRRGEAELPVTLTPAREGERFVIGIRPDYANLPCTGVGEAVVGAVQTTWNETLNVFYGLAGLFSRQGVRQVSGPLAILNMASDSARGGVMSFLFFLAVLSINLGVFNLLPVPPLDGIRIIMASWHALFGRPLREKYVLPVFQWGTLGLVTLFFLVTIKDLGSFFL